MYVTASQVRLALSPTVGDGAFRTTASDTTDGDIADAIARACAKVDLALSGQYVTPVAQVNGTYPEIVMAWAADLAAYYATLTWRQNQPLDPNSPIMLRYAETKADLAAVAAGTSTVPLPTPIPVVDNTPDGDLHNPCAVGLGEAASRVSGRTVLPIDFPYPVIAGRPRGGSVTGYETFPRW